MIIEHLYNTGLIESSTLSENEALAIIGADAWFSAKCQISCMDRVYIKDYPLDLKLSSFFSKDLAERFNAVPLQISEQNVIVAVSEPENLDLQDNISRFVNAEFVGSTDEEIQARIVELYGQTVEFKDVDTGDGPIVQLVQETLQQAVRMRASDIHIEPVDNDLRIRYRIDGSLVEIRRMPIKMLAPFISRFKIMTGTMSIDEKRKAQDGRIQSFVKGKSIDLRVSSIPSNRGESMVLRILDSGTLSIGLPQLGFLSDDQGKFEKYLGLSDGIILVTGPTGSGKTTTLYSCLHNLNKPSRKIITVEDPVEYEMRGINQVQVNAEVGMTFGSALRAMLRQAPNVIMIGEIRDAETANIAINASLTGHLVFSTLHTNDAPSAVPRLIDMGIAPFLISSSLRAVMAQRLVRTICKHCVYDSQLSISEMNAIGVDDEMLDGAIIRRGKGCSYCHNTGYRGRAGIFELFAINDDMRHLINAKAPGSELRKRARECGMKTLREDGIRKVLSGMTTVEEVISATVGDDA